MSIVRTRCRSRVLSFYRVANQVAPVETKNLMGSSDIANRIVSSLTNHSDVTVRPVVVSPVDGIAQFGVSWAGPENGLEHTVEVEVRKDGIFTYADYWGRKTKVRQFRKGLSFRQLAAGIARKAGNGGLAAACR